MLHKLKNRKQEGFTIIEVLIVLAIAGLILLIVFLAVPSLQRSSRNTQRKTDVGSIGSAAQTVLSNNNGDITALNTASIDNEVGANKLSFYDNANISVAAGASAVTNGTDINHVVVYTSSVCAAMTGGGRGATTTGATKRSIAVVYSTENGGTPDKTCIEE